MRGKEHTKKGGAQPRTLGHLERNCRLEKDLRRKSGASQSPENVVGEQLSEALKKGEFRGAHRFVEDSCRTRGGNKKKAPVQATCKETAPRRQSKNLGATR